MHAPIYNHYDPLSRGTSIVGIGQLAMGMSSLVWPHPSEKSEGSGQLPAPFSFSPPESEGAYFHCTSYGTCAVR